MGRPRYGADHCFQFPGSVLCLTDFVPPFVALLIRGVYLRYCSDDEDAADFVLSATQSAGLNPYQRPMTRAEAEEKAADKSKGGLLDNMRKAGAEGATAWVQMLQRIPNMRHKAAISIALKYPSAFALLKAYRDTSLSLHQKQNLLAGLKPGTGGNAIGPTLSAKVHHFFTLQGPEPVEGGGEDAPGHEGGGLGGGAGGGGDAYGDGGGGGAFGEPRRLSWGNVTAKAQPPRGARGSGSGGGSGPSSGRGFGFRHAGAVSGAVAPRPPGDESDIPIEIDDN